jgi:hypothetical protein
MSPAEDKFNMLKGQPHDAVGTRTSRFDGNTPVGDLAYSD